MKLEIGDYVIDEDSTASTTVGAQLRLNPGPHSFKPSFAGNELRIENLLVIVEKDTKAACKTAVDAITEALDNEGYASVTFSQSADEVFEMLNTEWTSITGEYSIDMQGKNALIMFSIVASRDMPAQGGGIPSGGLGSPEWSYSVDLDSGVRTISLVALFGPRDGVNAITNAQDFFEDIEENDNFPPFIEDKEAFRNVFFSIDPTQIAGKDQNSDDNFKPVSLTASWSTVPPDMPDIPDTVSDVIVDANLADDPPMHDRGLDGADGGATLTLSVNFTIRREAAPGAPAVEVDDMYALCETVFGIVETQYLSAYQSLSGDFLVLGEPVVNFDTVTGASIVTRSYRTHNTMEWSEDAALTNSSQIYINRDYKGKERIHQLHGGSVRMLTHSLKAVKIGQAVPYVPPRLAQGWVRIDRGGNVKTRAVIRGGTAYWTTIGSSVWRYVNENETPAESLDPTGFRDNPQDMDGIGNGRI